MNERSARRPATPKGVLGAERNLGRVLATGGWLSSGLLLAGLALGAVEPQGPGPFLINVGLLVLMVTPAARVTMSLIEQLREGEWLFAACTLTVLSILATTVLIALRTT